MTEVKIKDANLPGSGLTFIHIVGNIFLAILILIPIEYALWTLADHKVIPRNTTFVLTHLVFLLFLFAAAIVRGSRRAKRKIVDARRKALTELAGAPLEHFNTNGTNFTIGITANHLLIQEFGKIAAIPFGAIRDIWWEVPGYEIQRVTGFSPSALAAAHYADKANWAAFGEALRNSGLFVQVADIRKPVWRFFTRNAELLQQWEEILAQAFERTTARNERFSNPAA